MGKTSIEWTRGDDGSMGYTWNPVRGCSVVSEGCRNCYAMQVAARFSGEGQAYAGLAYRNESGAHWTGKVTLVEKHLADPLRWQRPRRIFVNSMSDLFHESLTDQQITDVFGVMALAHWHTFQVLTKRPARMLEYLRAGDHGIIEQFTAIQTGGGIGPREMFRALDVKRRDKVDWLWPLPNVCLGVSVEDQKSADARIPLLLQTPAAVRWLSVEPLLGPVNLNSFMVGDETAINPLRGERYATVQHMAVRPEKIDRVDWVVVGGESGNGARPMSPQWARSLRDQCVAASVPFFFKQWGNHAPLNTAQADANIVVAMSKKTAGRLLDGREWNEMPAEVRV